MSTQSDDELQDLQNFLEKSFKQFLDSEPNRTTDTSCVIAANYVIKRVEHLLAQHKQAAILAGKIEELESLKRVYDAAPDVQSALENTCVEMFARLRQLQAEQSKLSGEEK